MGLIILTKARRSIDFIKLRWMLSNPISRRVISELLQVDNGKFKIERFLDSYPKKPACISNFAFQHAGRVLEAFKEAVGPGKDIDETMKGPIARKAVINTLLTLREYGVRFPQRFYAPLMVVWNLTWRCNLRCKHCYEDAGALRGEKAPSELPLEEKLAAVDQIADSFIPTLSLSGGEPLIHPHFWPVAEAARDRGLYLSLNTNGTLITDEVAQRLADLGFAYVGVSVDAPSEEYHDDFRGVPGSWQSAVNGIKSLSKASVQAILSFTVTSKSVGFLPEMLKLADDLNVAKIMVYNFIPTGRSHSTFEFDPSPEQREEALNVIYDYMAEGNAACGTPPQLGRVCRERGRSELMPWAHAGSARVRGLDVMSDVIGGCGAGRAYIALQPDGTITPCVFMPDVPIGNIRQDEILDVWHNHELMQTLSSRSTLKGHCGVCEHNAVCGGCRARAYYYYGDFSAPDPGCIRNKGYLPDSSERAAG